MPFFRNFLDGDNQNVLNAFIIVGLFSMFYACLNSLIRSSCNLRNNGKVLIGLVVCMSLDPLCLVAINYICTRLLSLLDFVL